MPILSNKIINMLPTDPLFHKPKSIIAAKNILYATLFLGAINWTIAQFTSELHKSFPVQSSITIVLTLLIFFILIRQIGLGRKWARIVLLVLIVAGILLFPWTLAMVIRTNMLVAVMIILEALLQLWALVFLFSRESTEWFDRVQLKIHNEPHLHPGSKHS